MATKNSITKSAIAIAIAGFVGTASAATYYYASSASLPSGYTELPYVESTGANQWIYTDYVPEWNHRIVVKFMVKQVGTWNFPGVFCARGTANNDRGYSLLFAQGGSSRPNLPGQLQLFTGGWAMQSGYYLDLNCQVPVKS